MTKDILSDEEISHPLNETLLTEANEIKAERKLLKERLEKLDQNREGVSTAVYQKVRNDYTAKLQQTTNRLLALKKDLEKEEKTLVEKKNLVEVNAAFHKETIEEARLRHSLGEFTEGEHDEIVKKENKELARLESALKKLNEGIERHMKIFEGEELILEKKEAQPPPPKAARPTPPPPPPPQNRPEPVQESIHEQTAKIRVKPPPMAQEPADEPRKVAEVLVMENGKVVQMVPIDKTIEIGRSPANDIVLKEPKVSRKHAEIQFVGGKYVLLDLESSNGTFVSGKKVTEYTLQPNDEIVIGNTKMVFKI